ncbi:protein of unknown function [Xenorhabdus bovienii]|uniref:Uncharacterized protein n=1 Tax=Xenorhabdus bovienii TaxID=40576 RepID=A0A0B6XB85_XENBV|nr:protein of unknown function [Xenorhabdus bovienii]
MFVTVCFLVGLVDVYIRSYDYNILIFMNITMILKSLGFMAVRIKVPL